MLPSQLTVETPAVDRSHVPQVWHYYDGPWRRERGQRYHAALLDLKEVVAQGILPHGATLNEVQRVVDSALRDEDW